MAQSTGIVLATGAVTLGNLFILGDQPADPWNEAAKVIVATGIVAGTLAVIERPAPELAVAIGWAAFMALMITRLDPDVPSPTERLFAWWEKARK
jgi:hypothetical protein